MDHVGVHIVSTPAPEPLAICGSACRFPSSANREELWQALRGGRDLVTRVEAGRFAQDPFLHPRKSEPGSTYTFAAGSLGDITGFDAEFFGISPREAIQMDPQQRLLLELAWETLEDAGIAPSRLRGTRCGVFLGFSGSDYSYRLADDLGAIDSTTMTGNTASIAANRLSYVFDLHGPSMAIDTACSSALVAFHQACRSVRDGESSAALTGAVGLHLHPFAFVGFSKASMLSPRGRCTPFAAGGDGYVRSEGGGLFLIKRLKDALADGDRVLAVILDSAVNADGRKQGLTVPNPEAQAALLRDLYGRCRISPDEITYVEAHGTGTAVGDPLETHALGEALGRRRAPGRPLPIGSVKSNLGHLEVASGVAGLVKALLCLEHREVPPTIHLDAPNPHIDFAGLNLLPVTEPLPLSPEERLVVGVSSFGFGGANAHVVLASPEPVRDPTVAPPPPVAAPLLLSARTDRALQALAGAVAEQLRTRAGDDLYAVAAAAALRRDPLPRRLAVPIADRERLCAALTAFAAGEPAEDVTTGQWIPAAAGPVFVYAGNGSQWSGMGQALLAEEPAFRDAIAEVDALFAPRGGFSILEALTAPANPERLAATEVAQPLLFAIQVALTQWLAGRGIVPAAVVGHSVGEVAAAWACGALTLAEAVRVIHERSHQQGRTRGAGVMTAVACSEEDARALTAGLGLDDRLWIAGVNSPRSVTLAGTPPAMAACEQALTQRSIWFRRLDLDYAFHSPAMDPLREDLVGALQGLAPEPSAVPFYSTVSGTRLDGEALGADYWWRNVREPVRFGAAVEALLDAGLNCFVEIGPSPILRGYLNESLRGRGSAGVLIPTLTREAADRAQLERCFLQVLMSGVAYDWTRLFPLPAPWVALPSYPWQRAGFFLEPTAEALGLLGCRTEHPLLGYRRPGESLQWEQSLDTLRHPWLADHAVGDTVVFPAAAFAEMALAAAARWQPERRNAVEDLDILAPLLLDGERSKLVRLAIDPADGRFWVRSRARQSTDPWLLHALGRICEDAAPPSASPPPPPAPDAPGEDADTHYRRTARVGLDYGVAFRAVERVWTNGGEARATLTTPAPTAEWSSACCLHPTYLDAAFQLLADVLAGHAQGGTPPAFIPIRIGRLRLLQSATQVATAEARVRRASRRAVLADFRLYDAAGGLVAVVDEARFRAVMLRRRATEHARQLRLGLVPRPRPEATAHSVVAAAADLAAQAARSWHDPQRLSARRRYLDEAEPLLEVLCGAFAQRTLRTLEPFGTWIDPDQLLATGAVIATAEPLLRGLLKMLADDGVLEQVQDRWLWRDEAALPDPQDIWISLMGDYPDQAALIALAGRAGWWLPQVLAGTLAPERVLGIDIDPTALGPYGTEPGLRQQLARTLAELVDGVAVRLPAGRRPRVLELIGPTVEPVCVVATMIGPPCDLVVAVPHPDHAKEVSAQLIHQPAASVRVLDPEVPARAVDLGGWFDLILVRGTSAAALRNARTLIAQDGGLVLCEQYPTRAQDMIFGLYPHWWSPEQGQPRAARPQGPRAWQRLLARHGFADTAILADTPTAKTGHFLILARPEGEALGVAAPAADAGPASGPWLLMLDATPDSAALGQALADALRARGESVVRVINGEPQPNAARPGDPPGDQVRLLLTDPAAWARLLADPQSSQGQVRGIVHLAGLDFTPNMDPASRLARQEWRAGTLLAALQGCIGSAQRPDCFVITAGAGSGFSASPMGTEPALDSAQDAPLWGLARVAMNEFPGQRVRWIDLAERLAPERAAELLAAELLVPDAEDEIILRAAERFAPRLQVALPATETADRTAEPWRRIQLDFSAPGPLRNLVWQGADLPAPGPGEVEIAVRAVGLNFRDVMYAMGLLPDEALENGFSGQSLGMELAGVVTAVGPEVTEPRVGEEVIAFAPAAFATRVITQADAVVAKPPGWSYAAAATVPTAFFTAYYALAELARLGEGERVLIHGAAGGVGLAAIQIAKTLGAEVFATAGTVEKRDLVGMLGADHVFDSRSLAFADEILERTGGEGVDCVLNSLSGEAIHRNLRVLRPFGRFLELGKRDFYENTSIGLRPFRNNIAYYGIDADQLMRERPALARRVFLHLMSLFGRGLLKPLPYRAFDATEVLDAFRYMQHSRQIGKVVVTIPGDFGAGFTRPIPVSPLRLRADGTYLVTGGLSGFGLRTAQWLAARGAGALVLLGRRGEAEADAPTISILEELRATGVEVYAPACDVTDGAALARVLVRVAADLPPLRGVVHAAMVIDDALLRHTTPAQVHRVLAPKVSGALHLDALTRDLPLDFFVLYSSATTMFGSPGQGAYVAANMALEALANDRRRRGAPATCVAWGPLEDVGYLARHPEVRETLVGRMGGQPLRADEALETLERMLTTGATNLAVLDLAWGTIARTLPSAAAPKYQELAASLQDTGAGAEGDEDLRRWLDSLDPDALRVAVTDVLRKELGEILRLAPDGLDIDRSVYDMGMDSLMGVELITALDARLGISLPLMAVSEGPTIARLCERIVHQLRPGEAEPSPAERTHQAAQLAGQHGSAAEQALLLSMAEDLSTPRAAAAVSLIRETE